MANRADDSDSVLSFAIVVTKLAEQVRKTAKLYFAEVWRKLRGASQIYSSYATRISSDRTDDPSDADHSQQFEE